MVDQIKTRSDVGKAKQLTSEQLETFFKLTSESEISLATLTKLFGYTQEADALYNPSDYFKLPKNRLYNASETMTTVGRYVFNKIVLTSKTGPLVGYVNYRMTDSGIGKLDGVYASLLLDDKITSQDYVDYLDKMEWLGFSIVRFVNPSLTTDLIIPPDTIKQQKKELLEKYKDKFYAADPKTVSMVEKTLLKSAKEELKDKPDMDIYNSGSRGSFGNNYKNVNIFRGLIPDVVDPSKMHVSSASLSEGIPPEEQTLYANIATIGASSRALATRQGGYVAKQLASSFQGIVLDKHGSDCHSNKTVNMLLTSGNYSMFKERYIVDRGKLVLLDDNTKNRYLNHMCKFRSPMFCQSKTGICNKCAGELYYKLGIKNVGLIVNLVGNALVSLSMKSFHDMSVKVKTINLDDYID